MVLQTELWSAAAMGGLALCVAAGVRPSREAPWKLPAWALLVCAGGYLGCEGGAQLARAFTGHALPEVPHTLAGVFGGLVVVSAVWLAETAGAGPASWAWVGAAVVLVAPNLWPPLGARVYTAEHRMLELAFSTLAFILMARILVILVRASRRVTEDWTPTILAAVSPWVIPTLAVQGVDGFVTMQWILGTPASFAARFLLDAAVSALVCWRLVHGARDPRLVRTAWAIAALNGIVLFVWLVFWVQHSFTSLWEGPAWTVRYLLMLIVLRRGILRFGVADGRRVAVVRTGGAVMLALVAASGVATVLSLVPGVSLGAACVVALGVTMVGLVIWAGLRRSQLVLGRPQNWRAHAAYRSLVQAHLPRTDLERARLELGLTVAEAGTVERRLELEQLAVRQAGRPLAQGDVVAGVYRIESFLGPGGNARAFVAWDAAQERRVVVKEYRTDGGVGERELSALAREARVLAQLRHPGRARMLDVISAPGSLMLVLERVEGSDLRARLLEGRLPEPAVRRIVRDVGSALLALHTRGIVHCDVKPENIVVGPRGNAVLVDFGSALLETRRATLGHVAHTPRYASPELTLGGHIGPPADVYAMGRVACELLSGTPEPEGLPPAWRYLMERALATDPSARPSMDELLRHVDEMARRPPDARQANARHPPRRAAPAS